jgi:hypothetical protein
VAGVAAPPSPGATTSAPLPDPQGADLADERALLAQYDATLSRHRTLATRLAPLRSDHLAHVRALEHALGLEPAADPTGRTSPTSSTSGAGGAGSAGGPTGDSGSPAVPTVPASPAAALAALRTAERTARAHRSAAALAAASSDRAALLASIAACEASHGLVLTPTRA